MCYSSKSKALRITAGIMGLMMLILVLFSAFYIATEADHDCCGEDCPICAYIHQCENTLRGIGDGTAVRPVIIAPVILFRLAAAFTITAVSRDTLISRKVRLNN